MRDTNIFASVYVNTSTHMQVWTAIYMNIRLNVMYTFAHM